MLRPFDINFRNSDLKKFYSQSQDSLFIDALNVLKKNLTTGCKCWSFPFNSPLCMSHSLTVSVTSKETHSAVPLVKTFFPPMNRCFAICSLCIMIWRNTKQFLHKTESAWGRLLGFHVILRSRRTLSNPYFKSNSSWDSVYGVLLAK